MFLRQTRPILSLLTPLQPRPQPAIEIKRLVVCAVGQDRLVSAKGLYNIRLVRIDMVLHDRSGLKGVALVSAYLVVTKLETTCTYAGGLGAVFLHPSRNSVASRSAADLSLDFLPHKILPRIGS